MTLTSGNHCDQFHHVAILQDLIVEDHLALARGDHRFRNDIDLLQSRKQCHAWLDFEFLIPQNQFDQVDLSGIRFYHRAGTRRIHPGQIANYEEVRLDA